MPYDHKQIAKELIDTALGNAYYGNALYVARDFQFLTVKAQGPVAWLHRDAMKGK